MKQPDDMTRSASSMRPVCLLVVFILLPHLTLTCCCTLLGTFTLSCRCNIFACNCHTDNGWCFKYYDYDAVCMSSKGRKEEEFCPDRSRKISVVVSQAYGGLHRHLIGRDAMENFITFDLNWDGLISLEEAMETNNKSTVDEFNQVDVNNDGFVEPSEFGLFLV